MPLSSKYSRVLTLENLCHELVPRTCATNLCQEAVSEYYENIKKFKVVVNYLEDAIVELTTHERVRWCYVSLSHSLSLSLSLSCSRARSLSLCRSTHTIPVEGMQYLSIYIAHIYRSTHTHDI